MKWISYVAMRLSTADLLHWLKQTSPVVPLVEHVGLWATSSSLTDTSLANSVSGEKQAGAPGAWVSWSCMGTPRAHRTGPSSPGSTCLGQLESINSSGLPVLPCYNAKRLWPSKKWHKLLSFVIVTKEGICNVKKGTDIYLLSLCSATKIVMAVQKPCLFPTFMLHLYAVTTHSETI